MIVRPSRATRSARLSRGVTLIELLIAMVIMGILASIAVPGYNSYIRKARRSEAKAALLDIASLEERYFSVNNSYSALSTDLGYTGAWPVTVGGGYYQVLAPVIVAATAPTAALPAGIPASYTLKAQPIGDQLNDTACLEFDLTSAGLKTNTGPDPNCWN